MKSRIQLSLLCLILPVFCLTVSGGWFLCKKAYISAKIFAQSEFDYDLFRRKQAFAGAALKARDLLPPGADVSIPFKSRGFSYVIWRYFLFPHHIAEKSDYHLDEKNRVPGDWTTWVEVPLPGTVSLYVRPHLAGQLVPVSAPALPLPFVVTAGLFFSGYNILTGIFILRALGFDLKEWGRGWYYATAYLLGYMIPTAVIWILMMLGLALSRGAVLGVWGILLVFWGWLSRRSAFPDERGRVSGAAPQCRGTRFAAPFVKGLVVMAAAGVFVSTVATGVLDWDGMSHWILKSKAIYFYHHLNFKHTHLNIYPLLWPLNIACQFTLLGGMYDELAKWTSGFCFLVFIIQLLKSLQILELKPVARHGVVLFYIVSAFHDFTKPWWYVNFTFGNAENLFLAFFAGILTVILAWIKKRNERQYLWLALILMMGLKLTKLEGIATTGILGVTMLLLFRKDLVSQRAGGWIVAVFLSIWLPLGWMKWIQVQGFPAAMTHLKEGVSIGKCLQLFKINVKNYCSNNMPVYSLIFGLYVLVFRKRSRWLETEIFLGMVSAGMVFFVWVAHRGFPPSFSARDAPVIIVFCQPYSAAGGRAFGCAQRIPIKDDCGRNGFSV
ncbi:MAG: hypothetical protein WC450_08815 [Candidatus Omnitrophota bacterium]|jgi:hypothetical protein